MEEKELFTQVYKVSQTTGSAVYVVGGWVRDRVMDTPNKVTDIDFVVQGSGLLFARAFAALLGEQGTLVEFPDFDTARYVLPEVEVEFAGARTEQYESGSRKPKVTAADLEQDLARRDFTVNAMARQVTAGGISAMIIDPFNGQNDIREKIIRTPLEPNITFTEDPLRMLRAARFASQLHFTIEAATLKAMYDNRERLKIVSQERIRDELFKLLATEYPSEGLWILYNTQLIDQFLPEITELAGVEEMKGYLHKDNLAHTFKVVDNIAEMGGSSLLRYAGLMHDIAKPQTKQFDKKRGWTFDMHEHVGKKMVREIGRRLRLSRDDTEYVAKLVRWHLYPIALMDEGVTDSPIRRLIVNLGDDLKDLLILCRADITTGNQQKLKRRIKNYEYLDRRIDEVIEKDKLRAFQSPVRGEEIMRDCGLRAGPTVGKIKTAIENAILDGEIPNEYEAARAYFEQIKDEYLVEAGDWERE